MKATFWCALVVLIFGCCGALPIGEKFGKGVSLLGEEEQPDPEAAVPIRGPDQARANAKAVRIEHETQRQQDEDARLRRQEEDELSKTATRSTTSLDTALRAMDADRRPIDVMAGKYKSLAVTSRSTPKSVKEAEAHEARVSSMEVKMKQTAQQHKKMLESHTNKKIPTLEGMEQTIKTTIDANMKEQLKDMPYGGIQGWEDVLPSEDAFYKPWKGNAEFSEGTAKKGDSKETMAHDEIEAENAMLSQRQSAIANQEKQVEIEKDMLKGQMAKVVVAANHMQDEVADQEHDTELKAQKKVHDAAFAINEAMQISKRAHMSTLQEKAENTDLKYSLRKAIAQKALTAKAAAHEEAELKDAMSLSESRHIQALKKMAQTHIHAMSRAASKIAKRLFVAQEQVEADKARIKYLESKVVLLGKQDERQREELARNIEKKESSFWNQQLTQVEHQASASNQKMQKSVLKAEQNAAHVTSSALHSQQAMQAMKMPLEAQKLADKLNSKDSKKVKQMTEENVKLKERVKMLEDKLQRAGKLAANQEATLIGKDKANKALRTLIGQVNDQKQQAEDAALNNAAQVEIEHQKVVDQKEDLSAEPTKKDMDELLSTPCEGKACDDMQTDDMPVIGPKAIFPELLKNDAPKTGTKYGTARAKTPK